MKKLLTLLIAILTLSTTSFADTIAYVDMEQIFLRANMVKQFEKNIAKKRESFDALLKKNQAKIEKAKSKGKSDSDLQKMVKKFEEELGPKQQELRQLEAGFQQNLLLTVTNTVEEICEKRGIDIVIPKQVVLYGKGVEDLTYQVLDQINAQ